MRAVKLTILIAAVLLVTLPAVATTTIDTLSSPLMTYEWYWGHGNYPPTLGQTFTAAGDGYLQQITVRIVHDAPSVQSGFYLMQWDQGNFRGIGPVTTLISNFSPQAGGLTVPVNTQLNPGSQYVFFASTSLTGYAGPGSGHGSLAAMQSGGPDLYSGGGVVNIMDGDMSSSGWTTQSWSDLSGYSPDLAFNMTFGASPITVVPEPMTCIGVIGGLASLGAYLRRRKAAGA